MTRQEILQQIKQKGLVEKANNKAVQLYGYGRNYTNLPTATLLSILDTAKSKQPKATQKTFVDEGARRAIKAIASLIGVKDIEKNFNN